MNNQSFLCRSCEACMCQDCIDIATEYQDLEQLRKIAMMQMEEELNEARLQRDSYKRRAEMWERIAKAGLPDVIGAWAGEEIGKLLGEEVRG